MPLPDLALRPSYAPADPKGAAARGAAATTGFYGKIPAAGDFVSWNLPRSFTDRWDRWFSAELLARPDTGSLDPRAWRFVVPAGVFGDQPVAGVWRMSEDRAGRRYPFVIARLGPTPDPGDPWFDVVEEVLVGAIEDFDSFVKLVDKVGRAPLPLKPRVAGRIVFWLDDWHVEEIGFKDANELSNFGLNKIRTHWNHHSEIDL